ncbi:MAG: DUF6383 domain-containing protein [Clostridium sp.]|nr:DUF6383 domain-containing protein [Clostridium sp.]
MKRMSFYLSAALLAAAGTWTSFALADTYGRYGVKSTPSEMAARQDLRRANNGLLEAVTPAESAESGTPAPAMNRPAGLLHRSAAAPVGNLYIVSPNYEGQTQAWYGIYGKIDIETGSIKTIASGNHLNISDTDYDTQTGAVRNGYLYIPDFDQNMVTLDVEYYWNKVDATTGRSVGKISFGSDSNWFFHSLTYDPVRDCFWGLHCEFGSGSGGNLRRIDCQGDDESKWKVSDVLLSMGSSETDFMSSICYNPLNGKLIGLKGTEGALYEYEPETNKLIMLYQYDQEEAPYMFPSFFEACPMVYSPRDKAFIGAVRNISNYTSTLFSIDAETYEAFEIAYLTPRVYATTLYCPDVFAMPEAPDAVSDFAATFENANLSGSITLKMPATNFEGIAYESGKKLDLVVKEGDNVLLSGKYNAGQSVTFPLTLTEGLHKLSIAANDGNLKGAETIESIYTGYDAPLAPTDEYLGGMTIMWETPNTRRGGANGGYIIANDITYDVYDGETKLNTAPIKGNEFEIPMPAALKRFNLTVRAVHHGHSSEPTGLISRVLGPGMALPANFTPTPVQADLFDMTTNNPSDPQNFKYYPNYGGIPMFRITGENYADKPNAYLFMPKVHIADVSKLYQLSFTYQNAWANAQHANTMDVILRKDFDSSSDDKVIFGINCSKDYNAPKTINVNFRVTEPGDYYIVFHEYYTSTATYPLHRGARYYNFNVQEIEGSSTKAPGNVTDLKITPGDKGERYANISLTLPTVDLDGNALNPNETVTATATSGNNTAKAEGKPGEKVNFTINTDSDALQNIEIVCSTATFGNGLPQIDKVYIGLDAPTSPTNIRHTISEDNMKMRIEWDAPTVGVNGGYVDPEGLTYNIYAKNSVNNILLGTTKELYWDYSTDATSQTYYYVGPSAKNELGESMGNMFAFDHLGTPYQIPMIEEFSNTGFTYTKWQNSEDGEFVNTQWGAAANVDGFGYGDPVCILGCLYGQATSNNGAYGQLIAPKFTTKGVPAAKLTVRYWNFYGAPVMEVWARTSKDQTYKKVMTETPTRPNSAAWANIEYELPAEMLDCGWVQINIRPRFANATQMFLIDSYNVEQNVDTDFKVSQIKGQYHLSVGETPEYTIVAVNSGKDTGRTRVIAELMGDDEVLASKNITSGNLKANDEYELKAQFLMAPEYLQYKRLYVRGRVESDGDQVTNNDSREFILDLDASTLPVVTDLQGDWASENFDAINFSWSAPATGMSNIESFEAMPVGGNHAVLGRWKNIDLDGLNPFYVAGNGGAGNPIEWEDYDKPGAWQVLNTEELGILYTDRIAPYRGKQTIIARSAGFDPTVEEAKPVADFLISPEVKGGTQVSFWFNTVASDYAETITVFYSAGSDEIPTEGGMENLKEVSEGVYQIGDFKQIRHFTKSGVETWEKCTFTLPADAKYFAFCYRSKGQFGALLDEIEFTPATEANYEIKSYNLYSTDLQGVVRLVKSDIAGTSLNLPAKDENKIYAVTAIVSDGTGHLIETPMSNLVRINSSAVDGIISDNAFIAGGKGMIIANGLNGQTLNIYSLDGKLVKKAAVTSDSMYIPMDGGIFLVKVGQQTAKVLVK